MHELLQTLSHDMFHVPLQPTPKAKPISAVPCNENSRYA
jgi:hypothetical protein